MIFLARCCECSPQNNQRKAHGMLGCAPGQHLTLADLRAMKILPRETVDAFAALLTDPRPRGRRVAFVVAPTLVRNQLLRALAGRDDRYFAEPAEAKAWLLEEGETALRPPHAPKEVPLLRSVA